jgi:hypothetical protein
MISHIELFGAVDDRSEHILQTGNTAGKTIVFVDLLDSKFFANPKMGPSFILLLTWVSRLSS